MVLNTAQCRNLSLITLLLGVSIIMTACSGDSTPTPPVAATSAAGRVISPSAGKLTVVRLGYLPSISFAPLFVAIERGYFAQEGIDAQLTPVQTGSDSVVQLAAGNFDAAVGGAGASLFNAVDRGVKFTIVAPLQTERPPVSAPLVISAKRKDEIKSVADLKGKKVAINTTAGIGEYFLSLALNKGGLTIDDVQLTTAATTDMPALLQSGSVDAAILTEPYATQNEDNGMVSVLSNDYVNGFTSSYLYMGEPLLTGKPMVAKGFLRAFLRACGDLQGDYLKTDPGIAAIIEKYTQVPADVVARVAAPQYTKDGVVPVGNLQSLQTFFLQRGELEYKQPIDVTSFVDDSQARQVASGSK
jgi:NitT/TauT family transport system substrate-binding protein